LVDTLEELVKNSDVIDEFRLELVLKYLYSDSLQKRVKGVNDLNYLLKKALRKKSFYTISEEKNSWLEPSFMVTWLLEKGIVEYVLGGKMHQEVLQRTSLIFGFLARHLKFTKEHLDLLWDSCMVFTFFSFFLIFFQGKGDDEKACLFSILSETAPFLTMDLLNDLLLKIEHIPPPHYTHNTLKLIKKITITELDRPDTKVPRY
jgi:hypothetical protein